MIGSTDEDPIPKEEIERALISGERATVQGLMQEMDIVKQKLENCYDKLSRMTGLVMTMQNEFDEYKLQRVRELQVKVNGGPTAS